MKVDTLTPCVIDKMLRTEELKNYGRSIVQEIVFGDIYSRWFKVVSKEMINRNPSNPRIRAIIEYKSEDRRLTEYFGICYDDLVVCDIRVFNEIDYWFDGYYDAIHKVTYQRKG